MIITENGVQEVHSGNIGTNANIVVVYVSGEFDGCTLTLQYINELGDYVTLASSTTNSTREFSVHSGGRTLYVKVEGASANTNLSVMFSTRS